MNAHRDRETARRRQDRVGPGLARTAAEVQDRLTIDRAGEQAIAVGVERNIDGEPLLNMFRIACPVCRAEPGQPHLIAAVVDELAVNLADVELIEHAASWCISCGGSTEEPAPPAPTCLARASHAGPPTTIGGPSPSTNERNGA